MYYYLSKNVSKLKEKLTLIQSNSSNKQSRHCKGQTIWFSRKGVYLMPNSSNHEQTQRLSPPTHSFSQSQSLTHWNSCQMKKQFMVGNGRKTDKQKSVTLNKTIIANSLDLSHYAFMKLRESEKENNDRVIAVRRTRKKPIFYDSNSNHGQATINHLIRKNKNRKEQQQSKYQSRIITIPKNNLKKQKSQPNSKPSKHKKDLKIMKRFSLTHFFSHKEQYQKDNYVFLINLLTLNYIEVEVAYPGKKIQASIIESWKNDKSLQDKFKKCSKYLNEFNTTNEGNIFMCLPREKGLSTFFIWIGKPIPHYHQHQMKKLIEKSLKQSLKYKFEEVLADMGWVVWIINFLGVPSYFTIKPQ